MKSVQNGNYTSMILEIFLNISWKITGWLENRNTKYDNNISKRNKESVPSKGFNLYEK